MGGGGVAGVAIGLFALARYERERLRETLVEERIVAAEAEGELEAARAIQLGMVPPRARLRNIDPRIDLDALLPRRAPQRRRELAYALIIARLLDPSAKLATARMLDLLEEVGRSAPS